MAEVELLWDELYRTKLSVEDFVAQRRGAVQDRRAAILMCVLQAAGGQWLSRTLKIQDEALEIVSTSEGDGGITMDREDRELSGESMATYGRQMEV